MADVLSQNYIYSYSMNFSVHMGSLGLRRGNGWIR